MLLFYVQSSRLADMPESMSAPRKGTQTCLLLSGAHRATVTEERFFCIRPTHKNCLLNSLNCGYEFDCKAKGGDDTIEG